MFPLKPPFIEDLFQPAMELMKPTGCPRWLFPVEVSNGRIPSNLVSTRLSVGHFGKLSLPSFVESTTLKTPVRWADYRTLIQGWKAYFSCWHGQAKWRLALFQKSIDFQSGCFQNHGFIHVFMVSAFWMLWDVGLFLQCFFWRRFHPKAWANAFC